MLDRISTFRAGPRSQIMKQSKVATNGNFQFLKACRILLSISIRHHNGVARVLNSRNILLKPAIHSGNPAANQVVGSETYKTSEMVM